jgi:hypothetical protein
MIRIMLIQKHISFIEKKQNILIINKLKDKRKLLLEFYYIIAQIPSGYLQMLVGRTISLKGIPII